MIRKVPSSNQLKHCVPSSNHMIHCVLSSYQKIHGVPCSRQMTINSSDKWYTLTRRAILARPYSLGYNGSPPASYAVAVEIAELQTALEDERSRRKAAEAAAATAETSMGAFEAETKRLNSQVCTPPEYP